MTLRDAYALADYWAEFPPTHEVGRMFSAAFLKWSPARSGTGAASRSEPFKESTEEEVRAFVAAVKSAAAGG